MQICDYMIHNLKMFSMCVLNAKKNVSMMVNAKNNFNLFLKEMIGATSCDFFIYNLVENNTLVDDWSLMIMWLMLEIEGES